MRLEVRRRRRSLISLTPLIDVVFILLIFFMLASSFIQWRSVTLNTPAVVAGATSEAATLIRLHADGSIDLNARAVTIETLAATLRDVLGPDSSRRVLVQSDAALPLQRVVAVLDEAKRAGAQSISLVRE